MGLECSDPLLLCFSFNFLRVCLVNGKLLKSTNLRPLKYYLNNF